MTKLRRMWLLTAVCLEMCIAEPPCAEEDTFKAATFVVSPEVVEQNTTKFFGSGPPSIANWETGAPTVRAHGASSWSIAVRHRRATQVTCSVCYDKKCLWFIPCGQDCHEVTAWGRCSFAVHAKVNLPDHTITAGASEADASGFPQCPKVGKTHCRSEAEADVKRYQEDFKRWAQAPFLDHDWVDHTVGNETMWYRFVIPPGHDRAARLRVSVEARVQCNGQCYHPFTSSAAARQCEKVWMPSKSQVQVGQRVNVTSLVTTFTVALKSSEREVVHFSMFEGAEEVFWQVNLSYSTSCVFIPCTAFTTWCCTGKVSIGRGNQQVFSSEAAAEKSQWQLRLVLDSEKHSILFGLGDKHLYTADDTGLIHSLKVHSPSVPWTETGKVRERHCHGDMPETWPHAVREGARLSSDLMFAFMRAEIGISAHYNHSVLDASIVSHLHARRSSVDTQTATTWLLSMEETSMITTCGTCNASAGVEGVHTLMNATAGKLACKTEMNASKSDGRVALFLQVPNGTAPILETVSLDKPALPVSKSMLNAGVQHAAARMIPDINMHLKSRLSLVVPASVSTHIPLGEADCAPMQLRSINGSYKGAFMEFKRTRDRSAKLMAVPLATSAAMFLPLQLGRIPDIWWLCLYLALFACLVLMICIWLWSANEPALLVLAFFSIFHGVAWFVFNPFAMFSASTFVKLGISQSSFNVDATAEYFLDWGIFGATLAVAGADALLLAAFLPDRLPSLAPHKLSVHILACLFALLMHFLAITLLPMSKFTGQLLTNSSGSPTAQSNAPIVLLLDALNMTRQDATDSMHCAVNTSFTAFWVTLLGIYYVFTLLSLGTGVCCGMAVFAIQNWTHRLNNRTMDMAVTAVLLMEVLLLAALLGPLSIVHQILEGTDKCWVLCFAMCFTRILTVIAAYKTDALGGCFTRILTVIAAYLPDALGKDLSMPMVFATLVFYIAATVGFSCWLWCTFNDAVQRVAAHWVHLPGEFVTTSCLAVSSLAAFAVAVCLERHAKSDIETLVVVATRTRECISTVLLQCVRYPYMKEMSQVADRLRSMGACAWERVVFPILCVLLELEAMLTLYLHFAAAVLQGSGKPVPRFFDMIIFAIAGARLMAAFIFVFVGARPMAALIFVFVWARHGISSTGRGRDALRERFLAQPQEKPDVTSDAARQGTSLRREFLWLATCHGALCIIRLCMWRPPTLAGMFTDPKALQGWHAWLEHKFELKVPRHSDLDGAWWEYETMRGWSLAAQGVALLCILLAAITETRKPGALPSRLAVYLGSAIALVSFLLPLWPNYSKGALASHPLTGCAPRYDEHVRFTTHAVAGAGCAAALGSSAFGVLFTLPVSVTRGLWLMMIESKADSHLRDILSGLLQILSVALPCVTIFPLLYYNQLVMDQPSQKLLLAFWTCPTAIMAVWYKHHGETYFYCMWVVIYVISFGCFLWRQVSLFDINIKSLFYDIDWWFLLSAMHVDFCIMNVLIADVVSELLGVETTERPPASPTYEVVEQSTPFTQEEARKVCITHRESRAREFASRSEDGRIYALKTFALSFPSRDVAEEVNLQEGMCLLDRWSG